VDYLRQYLLPVVAAFQQPDSPCWCLYTLIRQFFIHILLLALVPAYAENGTATNADFGCFFPWGE
jgi:hypothetical protein